jgi:hypothetical protein
MEKEYWLKNKQHSHDFSGKFRSKTIYGEDIIENKQIPTKEQAKIIYEKGFEDVKQRIERVLTNDWSEKKIRNMMWKLIKHFFMYQAIKKYVETDTYIKNRKDLGNKELLNILNNIDNIPKEELLKAANLLLVQSN